MPNTITATESYYQHMLVNNELFYLRVTQHMLRYATTVVMTEPKNTLHHNDRVQLARQVMSGANQKQSAAVLANAPAIQGTITIEDGVARTSVTDQNLYIAIRDNWNLLAGVQTGA